MATLDEKDCLILNLLQENCRMTLTEISKKIGLSIDSTKKRLEKLTREKLFYPKIQIRPRAIGFPYIVDVKIKFNAYENKHVTDFIEYCIAHPRIPEVFSVSGEWDFTLVIIAKDHQDLAMITNEVRNKFSNLISEWSESLTTIAYKFEKYDILKLAGYEK